ncbi:nucleotidyltransferase domain-containing protein [Methanobacterium sp.]|uniref:nucleotidyltransferase domain-containing protein n=1 Tax=Methanobacterium sp. TaxID=2164 RepID=UPI0025D6475A|nr:nucleotidyltransferase domain-containing protein [Methanobacterium sp.]MBI5458131.1 nucleotidyltransferase domain-containing protein [Methanobacterium sp.]
MKDNTQDVLIKLIEQGDNLPTIRKISQMTGIRYTNVYNIIKKLEQENIIDLEKTGNAYQCNLLKKPNSLIFSAEYARRDVLTKNSDFKVLQQKLNFLPFPFIALLFGSYAKGSASETSDIDLMVIAEGNRKKEIERTLSILPLDIHLIFFTYEEFMMMIRSKEFSVVSEATKYNVILVGIEDYYRVMEIVG